MDNQQLLYVFNKLVNEDFIPESDRIMLGEKVFISGHTALQVVTIDKHKNLAIMLDSETTADEIQSLLVDIFNIRNRIFNSQPEDPFEFQYYLLRIWRLHKENLKNGIKDGVSYQTITEYVNFEALMWLMATEIHGDSFKGGFYRHSLKGLLKIINPRGAYKPAQPPKKRKGEQQDYDNEVINPALEILKSGGCPWRIDKEPIEVKRLETILRGLEEKYQSLDSNGHEISRNLNNFDRYFVINQIWGQTYELLKKIYEPKLFKKWKSHLDEKLISILTENVDWPLDKDRT